MFKKTKIIATISDQRCDAEFIRELYDNGMNIVRMNTAHQSPADSLKIIENVRKISDKIALMIDTKGPEIRTTASDYKISLKKSDCIRMAGDPSQSSTPECIYVTHAGFVAEMSEGKSVLIDDGEIEFKVIKKHGDHLICEAQNEGIVKGKKSVNVPGVSFNLPSLSQKDIEFINFAIEQDIDFIAHSFVRNKEDVLSIQRILDTRKSQVKIIAKIENQEGVDHIDEIIEHAFGIMVARGDLAVEVPYEKIPGIQRMIIRKCIDARKPVIIATQMLYSMIENPRPTRAEVSDVANAVYSKTDAIMLSGETAFGKYPVEAVATMSRIAEEVEKSFKDIHKTPMVIMSNKTSAYLSKSAVEASILLECKAIIADTSRGRTIRNVAGYRGRKPIFAQCYDKRVMRELALTFGVYADFLEEGRTHGFIIESLKKSLNNGTLQKNDLVVVLGGNFIFSQNASFIEINTVENLVGLMHNQS